MSSPTYSLTRPLSEEEIKRKASRIFVCSHTKCQDRRAITVTFERNSKIEYPFFCPQFHRKTNCVDCGDLTCTARKKPEHIAWTIASIVIHEKKSKKLLAKIPNPTPDQVRLFSPTNHRFLCEHITSRKSETDPGLRNTPGSHVRLEGNQKLYSPVGANMRIRDDGHNTQWDIPGYERSQPGFGRYGQVKLAKGKETVYIETGDTIRTPAVNALDTVTGPQTPLSVVDTVVQGKRIQLTALSTSNGNGVKLGPANAESKTYFDALNLKGYYSDTQVTHNKERNHPPHLYVKLGTKTYTLDGNSIEYKDGYWIAKQRIPQTIKLTAQGPRTHNGVDLYLALKAPVFAMADGKITAVVSAPSDSDPAGVRLTLQFTFEENMYEAQYMHLETSLNTEHIKVGGCIMGGSRIAFGGKTGNAGGTPPHVHISFFYYSNGQRVLLNNLEVLLGNMQLYIENQ